MADSIGSRYNADGTSDHGVQDDRAMLRFDDSGLTIHPDVVIDIDPSFNFTLTAPWTEQKIMGVAESRIILRSPVTGAVHQSALLAHALESGQRTYSYEQMLDTFPG